MSLREGSCALIGSATAPDRRPAAARHRAASSTPPLPPRRSTRMKSRLVLGLSDQAISSLQNFAVLVVVARTVNPHDFGVFTVAWSTLILGIGLSQALVSEPLLLKHAAGGDEDRRAATSDALAMACLLGLACGVPL